MLERGRDKVDVEEVIFIIIVNVYVFFWDYVLKIVIFWDMVFWCFGWWVCLRIYINRKDNDGWWFKWRGCF